MENNQFLPQTFKQGLGFEKNEQWDLAINVYDALLQLLPQHESAQQFAAEVHLRRGNLRYRLKNQQGAFDDVREAMRLNPAIAERLDGEHSRWMKK